MARVNLLLSLDPNEVEVYIQLQRKDGILAWETGYIDTGAEKSLFPLRILEMIDHTVLNSGIVIRQAGIAKQDFEVIEAKFTLRFEDLQGNTSNSMEVSAWFGDTADILIGFKDILEHATLFIDYRQSRTGWIELD
jgi:hypothetical protein